MSRVMTSAVKPEALIRLRSEIVTSSCRGLRVPGETMQLGASQVCVPVELVPSMTIRTIGLRNGLDGAGRCCAHDVRHSQLPCGT